MKGINVCWYVLTWKRHQFAWNVLLTTILLILFHQSHIFYRKSDSKCTVRVWRLGKWCLTVYSHNFTNMHFLMTATILIPYTRVPGWYSYSLYPNIFLHNSILHYSLATIITRGWSNEFARFIEPSLLDYQQLCLPQWKQIEGTWRNTFKWWKTDAWTTGREGLTGKVRHLFIKHSVNCTLLDDSDKIYCGMVKFQILKNVSNI